LWSGRAGGLAEAEQESGDGKLRSDPSFSDSKGGSLATLFVWRLENPDKLLPTTS